MCSCDFLNTCNMVVTDNNDLQSLNLKTNYYLNEQCT